jgi:hypothetical protein
MALSNPVTQAPGTLSWTWQADPSAVIALRPEVGGSFMRIDRLEVNASATYRIDVTVDGPDSEEFRFASLQIG